MPNNNPDFNQPDFQTNNPSQPTQPNPFLPPLQTPETQNIFFDNQGDQQTKLELLKKKKPSIFTKVANFFKLLGLFLIIIILILISVFIYIIINPSSNFAKSVASLPFVSDKINLPNSNSSSSENSKPINQILGLEQNIQPNISFASPTSPVTISQVITDVLPSVFSLTVAYKDSRFTSSGTGYTVTEDGLIVTNKHVIALACKEKASQFDIQAISSEGKIYDLELLSVDPIYDLALLKIKTLDQKLKPLSLANPKDIHLGMEVLAVGNVLGEFQNTVTKGIVSGVNRTISTGLVDDCTGQGVIADGLIQTDAAINQGNSGGPLFNASGQVIGMNTFGTQGAENVGLAIPSSIIVSAINSYLQNKQIVRPRIGVITQPITPLLKVENPWIKAEYGEILLVQKGIDAVAKGSSAEQAGLKTGDIILEINSEKIQATINNPNPLRQKLISLKAGDEILLTVLKQKSLTNNIYEYNEKPEQVKLILGKLSFDIK